MGIISHWFKGHLRDVPRDECFQLLESRQVGRIGFLDVDGPQVLPVNYAIDNGCVLIATSPASTLAKCAVARPVAFEVDEVDEFNEGGWSVIVRGPLSVVSGPEIPDEAHQPNPWVAGNRTLVLRITPAEVTGRYLLPA
jgi:nitroimidazol reductase NimA-like FMN-containing flavoprotein (pyridoxamine 5'-phosphate oxidase superfamily)